MTPQEKQDMVETVVVGIVAQGGPSSAASSPYGGAPSCYYQAPTSGRRCAIGLLMNRPTTENGGVMVGSVSTKYILDELRRSGVPTDDVRFLERIQNAHDGATARAEKADGSLDDGIFMTEFDLLMRRLCEDYDLRFPEEYI